ncbi:prolactin-releasing peptide receptor-like isoform X2 [Macrosteles quadrilineatus]|uniref:prolactin-releasing peptide receptor-like isoform X2 n=1 Tax=Macrosteles quadrilineatus TaxID=74068 RepID=UPI0023E236C8|nr:prolactin-releasing peptide receptor-like isoform X2 [Macrosteles quadrilineatus]
MNVTLYEALRRANIDTFSSNSTNTTPTDDYNSTYRQDIIDDKAVQGVFCLLYTTIFVLGLFGNVLVCYVVARNKAMHTVTNCFITNLALSDILLCVLAVPFTPLYSFLGRWIFGRVLCHMVAYAQGTSVYISTLTLTSIAIDRFFVIIYPFQPRMKLSTCLCIIVIIWVFSLLVTLPYGIYMNHRSLEGRYYCEEDWPSEKFRQAYGGMTATLQFILPFFIIAFCYVRVSLKLNDRARCKPGSKNTRKEEADRERKRRTNRMLIAMVTIFGVSWLPLNLINLLNDIYIPTGTWKYYYLSFFMVHALAMSSTCYNPFLYAWLNDNFRKEFKQVLPCFDAGRSGGPGSQGSAGRVGGWRSERTCNGNETCQETLLPTSVVIPNKQGDSPPGPPPANHQPNHSKTKENSRGWLTKSHDSVEVVLVAYTAGEDVVHITDPSDKPRDKERAHLTAEIV